MADARLTALRGLQEVFGQGGYSNLVLESLMRNHQLNGQERAFCTALFSGVGEGVAAEAVSCGVQPAKISISSIAAIAAASSPHFLFFPNILQSS